jgi:hypothetical protein
VFVVEKPAKKAPVKKAPVTKAAAMKVKPAKPKAAADRTPVKAKSKPKVVDTDEYESDAAKSKSVDEAPAARQPRVARKAAPKAAAYKGRPVRQAEH